MRPVRPRLVHIGTGGDQELGEGDVTVAGRDEQRRKALLRGDADVGTVFDQDVRNLEMPFFDCPHQRGDSGAAGHEVEVSAVLE